MSVKFNYAELLAGLHKTSVTLEPKSDGFFVFDEAGKTLIGNLPITLIQGPQKLHGVLMVRENALLFESKAEVAIELVDGKGEHLDLRPGDTLQLELGTFSDA